MVPVRDLKQFVPSEICLTCDGCCRFKEKESSWRPRIGEEEKEYVYNNELAERIFSSTNVDKENYLKTAPCHGLHFCTFFNPEENTCGIYHARPFECRLYPFLLTKKEGDIDVYFHWSCPHMQKLHDSEQYRRYVVYLKEYFGSDDVVVFLKNNPSLIGDYSSFKEELEFVFTIKFSDERS